MHIHEAGLTVITVKKTDTLDQEYISQIVLNSQQHHILDATPDDATHRFVDEVNVTQRLLYHEVTTVLVDEERRQLAGLAWFSKQIKSDIQADITYAHRLYEHYTGRGLSIPFAKASHAIASRLLGNVVSCLYTNVDNYSAIRTYEAVGYDPEYESSGRLRMRTQLKAPEWYEQA